jgi:hypothetical protein
MHSAAIFFNSGDYGHDVHAIIAYFVKHGFPENE